MTSDRIGHMAVAGEDIPAGSSCVLALIGNVVRVAGPHAGVYIGDAVETIREGFRVSVDNGVVREDDA